MTDVSLTDRKQADRSLSGRYLTFRLGKQAYGIGVLRVREIIRMTATTFVPQLPEYFKGVINLRGKVIPILDLRCKFQVAAIEDTERTCIVVGQVRSNQGGDSLIGLIVDAVEEVVQISPDQVENPPEFGVTSGADCVLGMAKVRDRVKILIDINRVVAVESITLPVPPRSITCEGKVSPS